VQIEDEEEREREKRKRFEVVRDTTVGGGGARNYFSPVLKVPRQCSLVLLVEVCLREGGALGSE
jgi:hypothetical protein